MSKRTGAIYPRQYLISTDIERFDLLSELALLAALNKLFKLEPIFFVFMFHGENYSISVKKEGSYIKLL